MVVFSDHVNAYHALMEHILSGEYRHLDGDGIQDLRGDAAVLVHLARKLAKTAPAMPIRRRLMPSTAPFVPAPKPCWRAARAADREAIAHARAALKPAFSRLFLRFG